MSGSSRFWNGFLTGIGVSQLYILLVYSVHIPRLKPMFEDFGGTLPLLTKMVTQRVFYIGFPLLIIVAVIIANIKWGNSKKKLTLSLIILILLGWIVLGVIWYGANLPILNLTNALG